jgi:hypothetical protein
MRLRANPDLQIGVKISELKQRLILENKHVLSQIRPDPGLSHPTFPPLSSEDCAGRIETDHFSLENVPILYGSRTRHARSTWITAGI